MPLLSAADNTAEAEFYINVIAHEKRRGKK
jgi:hypothetical protein